KNLPLLCVLLLFAACQQAPPVSQSGSPILKGPQERFPELFAKVQLAKPFPDGKTFADCTPKTDDASILAAYQAAKQAGTFDAKSFVETHFDVPVSITSTFQSDTSRSIEAHIEALWPVLTRTPDANDPKSTLIPLPESYIVPGGRFREIYYWDSYFTMLGLQQSPSAKGMVRKMVRNFAHLIEEAGFIPNGNRTYYLSRSQPPFFSLMVGVLAEMEGDDVWAEFLPALEKEHAFWMAGENDLSETNPAAQHTVLMDDGSVLNRYFDNGTEPRPESYREDALLADSMGRDKVQLYRDLRSACESGWDFSSRWFADTQTLGSIRTTELIPVDLNCLMVHLEQRLAQACQLAGKNDQAGIWQSKAEARQEAIRTYCWDDGGGYYGEFNWVSKKMTSIPSMAMAYPLFFNVATQPQAASTANILEDAFLKPGGFVSTLNHTGQQWDAPNGWAPLQWIGIKGLRNYGFDEIAAKASKGWIAINRRVYKNTGKMMEKYNVEDLNLEAGGGEYETQDGFGWSNGVLMRLLVEEQEG
ncbi:MAG: alpha,alpha-trehalase TreF, partial [Bacteroidota bacterium]